LDAPCFPVVKARLVVSLFECVEQELSDSTTSYKKVADGPESNRVDRQDCPR
jgi:hypothetical protein